jgi:hypothetical protein
MCTQGPEKLKVQLKEGEYTIYGAILGHRSGGMEATLSIVSSSPA